MPWNFNKSTRYALYAAMELTCEEELPVTAAEVAQRYRIPATVLAKVFQHLVRAGIAVGTRGTRGGYRLARAPAEVSVLDIIEAFEPARPPEQCLLADAEDEPCGDYAACRLRALVDEVDELARCTYASVSLETLAGTRSHPGARLQVVS
jgi:Rrf2 family protein